MNDVRHIETEYGVTGMYSYSSEYLDFEQYVVFAKETRLSITLAIIAIAVIMLLVTVSLRVTLIVLASVFLTEMFLVSLIYYWGLTFNSIVVVNIIVAIGFAVDYSAHIAYTYLTVDPPKLKQYKSIDAKRAYKAKIALSRMGSSIFHGGLALFLAIIVLSGSKSYIYTVFYRTWSGIIVFGMINGFIFIPVALSMIGPVDKVMKKEKKSYRLTTY